MTLGAQLQLTNTIYNNIIMPLHANATWLFSIIVKLMVQVVIYTDNIMFTSDCKTMYYLFVILSIMQFCRNDIFYFKMCLLILF